MVDGAVLVLYLRGSGTVMTNPRLSGWVDPVHVRDELSSLSILLHVLDLECCWRRPVTEVNGVDLHDAGMWVEKRVSASVDVCGVSEAVTWRTCGGK